MILHRHLELLSAKTGCDVTVFDLETTDLIGSQEFGVTEVGVMEVKPSGGIKSYSRLVNPESLISPIAMRKTGITQDMVANKKNWTSVGTYFKSKENSILSGFNIKSFDIPAIKKANKLYNIDEPNFVNILDVKLLCNRIHKTQKGKLIDYAREYAVVIDGDMHRALQDVYVTAGLLDKIIGQYGVDFVLDYMKYTPIKPINTAPNIKINNGATKLSSIPPCSVDHSVHPVSVENHAGVDILKKQIRREATKKILRIEFITNWMANHDYDDLSMQCIMRENNTLFPTEATVSFAILDALFSGKLRIEQFRLQHHQDAIRPILAECIQSVYAANDKCLLKPLWMEVNQHTKTDYLQLRICLFDCGHGFKYLDIQNKSAITVSA